MKKLFTTEYGSRLYGTATPTSDTDVKHIVLPSMNDLLLGKSLVNKVDKTNSVKFTKNSAEDIDEEFINVQTFAKDFIGGQTYALEMCFAVDYDNAGQIIHDPLFKGFCHELRNMFLTSNMTALIGYAVNQASLYSFKGERLNACRAAKELFEEMIENFGEDFKPVDCREIFENKAKIIAENFPKYFSLEEYAINHEGMLRPCIKLLEKILPYTSTFKTTLGVVNTNLKKYGSRADAASIDNVDWKAVMHARRVVDEGISILTDRKLSFPFNKEYVDFLLSIKRGELPREEVFSELNSRLEILKTLEANSTLPKKSVELSNTLDVWLLEWLRIWYGLEFSL
jgi:hypothetical protein